MEGIIQQEQQKSDNQIKTMTEAAEETERKTRLQRETMRADITQAEAHFQTQER